AAVEPYAGWGAYGPSKAALDHATAILAAEQPSVTALSLDPGDMNTRMHAEAEPGEDLSDLPQPESVVPALLRLVDERPHGTRHRASDVAVPQEACPAMTRVATAFELPATHSAAAPAEARGLGRDGVRLLVARSGRIEHAR